MNVADEDATIVHLRESSCSIARFGDGELNLAFGLREEVFENRGEDLAQRLREVLESEDERLLIAVPNIFSSEAKHRLSNPNFWVRYEALLRERLDPHRQYYSAFISRPDNVSHSGEGDPPGKSDASLVKPEYWSRLRSLWENRKIALVHFDEETLRHPLFANSESTAWIPCQRRDAWGENGVRYAEMLSRCLDAAEDLVLACAGPVATVLAHDVCRAGKQCIDLGQAARIYNEGLGLDYLHLH